MKRQAINIEKKNEKKNSSTHDQSRRLLQVLELKKRRNGKYT
jgi:hypothetical protein